MVQLKNLLKLIFLALWVVVNGKIEIVFDGGIENCGEGRSLDLSKLEFVPVNDTHVVLNGIYQHFCYLYDQIQNMFSFKGSFIFNIEVRSPWFVKLTFEKFQNGKWQPSSISRNIPDFCSVVTMLYFIEIINCILNNFVFRCIFQLNHGIH